MAHAALSDRYVLALVDLRGRGEGRAERYTGAVAGTRQDGTPAEADDGDGVWTALAVAIAEGRTIPALGREPGDGAAAKGAGVDAAPGLLPARLRAGLPHGAREPVASAEAPLGRDWSNTSVVISGELLVKAYRRVLPGLNLTSSLPPRSFRRGGVPRAAPGGLGGGRHA
ncbi:MAG: hypothetical protein U0838_14920 [Chloroflexota bacterium]